MTSPSSSEFASFQKKRKLKIVTGPFTYGQNTDTSVLEPTQIQDLEETRGWERLAEMKAYLGTLHIDTFSFHENLARLPRNRQKISMCGGTSTQRHIDQGGFPCSQEAKSTTYYTKLTRDFTY
jgi:hypothetical protein